MSAWGMIIAGDYEAAVAVLTQELAVGPSTSVFNNRGSAYLHLQQYDAAFEDFRAAERVTISEVGGACDGRMCGVAQWMAGREEEALMTWSEGVRLSIAGAVKRGDEAGGVTIGNLLMFGGIVRHDATAKTLALTLLKKRLRTKQSAGWPGPATRYLLGQLSRDELLAIPEGRPALRGRLLCQVHFYMAVKALADGDPAAYRTEIARALSYGRGAKLGAEYYLALHEAQLDRA